MTAGMKLFVAFFFLASLVAIASRSKFQEKFSSGTKSDLTGTFGGSGSFFTSSTFVSSGFGSLLTSANCFFSGYFNG
jgi:hypothetical protein